MRATLILHAALLALQASLSTQYSLPDITYPTRKIGDFTVVDTELVREAAAYSRNHSSDFVWNHIMRGWLYGTLILSHNTTLHTTTDAETHAVAALLHDLGWDETPGSPLISPDRRFEVDGAIAARDFIYSHTNTNTHAWDEHRVQLVWDAIALHTQTDIFAYKEDVVRVTGSGILMDFAGPTDGVTRGEYDAVIRAFPKDGFREGVNDTFTRLCGMKPVSTYGTFMQVWGDNYVANYSAVGHRVFDLIAETSDSPI